MEGLPLFETNIGLFATMKFIQLEIVDSVKFAILPCEKAEFAFFPKYSLSSDRKGNYKIPLTAKRKHKLALTDRLIVGLYVH